LRRGRGLISPYPESDRGKLDEGEVIGGELVTTGGDTPTLFDLVKEPLDQITGAVEIGAEVDEARAMLLREVCWPTRLVPARATTRHGIRLHDRLQSLPARTEFFGKDSEMIDRE
jgi:hypothetical protein